MIEDQRVSELYTALDTVLTNEWSLLTSRFAALGPTARWLMPLEEVPAAVSLLSDSALLAYKPYGTYGYVRRWKNSAPPNLKTAVVNERQRIAKLLEDGHTFSWELWHTTLFAVGIECESTYQRNTALIAAVNHGIVERTNQGKCIKGLVNGNQTQ